MPKSTVGAMHTEIDKVFSVCAQKHLAVWQAAAPLILRYIEAREYYLIVPDAEVADFKKVTPPSYKIEPESIYVDKVVSDLKAALTFEGALSGRYHWYLQQFIKLKAIESLKSEEIGLIWDADTVPIRPLHFISPEGKFCYYPAVEHHPPYFQSIAKLLLLEKKVPFSFISQCFVIKGIWAQEFFAEIENIHQKPWHKAIISTISLQDPSGFSEYEALGTWLSHRHFADIQFNQRKFLLKSAAYFNHPTKISPGWESSWALLNPQVDFIRYELYGEQYLVSLLYRNLCRIYRGLKKFILKPIVGGALRLLLPLKRLLKVRRAR